MDIPITLNVANPNLTAIGGLLIGSLIGTTGIVILGLIFICFIFKATLIEVFTKICDLNNK
jgi:hypothetical protein